MLSLLRRTGLGSGLALALAALPAAAYVGQWHAFTDKSRVTALAVHNGRVFAGTQGGIRSVDPVSFAQQDFDNLDGLLDPWVVAFARDSAGVLWAVGRDGYVYDLAADGKRWKSAGRAYQAKGWKMNDRAALSADRFLYLGSQKGLAIFDTRNRISERDLTRFGDDLDVQALSLLRRGDTLYVGTSAGVYKARVYFADPLNPPPGFANIADHNQWIKVELPVVSGRRYEHLAFIGDSLVTSGPGTLLQTPGDAPVRVEAFAGQPLVIESQTYPVSWNGYVAAVHVGGRVFAGGDAGLAVSANPAGSTPDAIMLQPLRTHPRDTIANIAARGGRVWGHAHGGLYAYQDGAQAFTEPLRYPGGDGGSMFDRYLRNVKVDDNGDVYVGTWGGGLSRLRDGAVSFWTKANTPCLQEVLPNYPVVHALSRPRGRHLYFALFYTDESHHQIAHLDTESGQVACLDSMVAGTYPHAVEILADTLVGVATERGVNFLTVREGVVAPAIDAASLWTLPGGTASEAWDLATDKWGRPWALIGDQLAYLDSLDLSTSHKLKPIENFAGTGCRSLEADAAGNLWIGCENGLYTAQTEVTGDIPSNAIRRYGLDDGLPSLFIYDVSVDPSNGKVWVATDRGVAMFESPAQPALPSGELAAIIPYPNPFRPQHLHVIFDRIPPGATLRIHEPAGRVVRTYHPSDRNTGNQVQWDGKNEQGRAVGPGVYLFSVTSGSKVQRGKVIVAR